MREVADIVRRYGDAYLARFGSAMPPSRPAAQPPSHRRALRDIRDCRTQVMGGHVYGCDRCGHRQYAYHSCKNRSCPKCQGDDTERWLDQRRQELLDVPHFHVVFTLPPELHPIIRRHQKLLYGLLMKAAAESLMKLAADPRDVGGRLGILAVLHTWTTTLTYHPHVHGLVPAGGVTADGCWIAAGKDYLVPVHALSRVFRGVFLQRLRKALPRQVVPTCVWSRNWVVYCQPTVQGTERVLQYLGRYVHRVAFANSRLVRIDDGQVTFRYLDRRQQRWKMMTLTTDEFLRRFLQHVLPRGTHKVRYYGFWNPSQRSLLRRIQQVTGTARLPEATQPPTPQTEPADGSCEPRRRCPCCGKGTLILVETIRRHSRGPP